MTAMTTGFMSNPRYQRYMAKIQAMRPEQRAILDTALVDKSFGDEEMKKRVSSLAIAADLANRQENLDLSRQRLDLSTALKRDVLDQQEKQQKYGTAIAAANIPLAGYLGYKQAQQNKEVLGELKKQRSSIY